MHTVRRVLHTEYHKYRTHLKALDSQSKYLRFGFIAKDTVIDKLCDLIESDKEHHFLFCIEGSDLEFLAVGHIALYNDSNMELALSVLDHCRGKGMGNALMSRCLQWCRAHRILSGNMVCLSTNSAIKHLCSKHGLIMSSEHGETVSNFTLKNAEIDTYISEATDRNLAIVDWLSKRTIKMFKPTLD